MRIAYYDNLKYILITIVVLGHLIGKLKTDFYTEYFFIYTFHMPVFIFISGYFSKKIIDTKTFYKLIFTLLIPYLFFETFYSISDSILYEKSFKLSFFSPNWGMWYLVSLLFWRLMLDIADKLKYTLPILILIAVMIGFTHAGHTLSISRTFVFFPFFYLGFYLAKNDFDISTLTDYSKLGYAILILFYFILLMYEPQINLKWLWGSYSYEKLNNIEYGLFIRLFIMFGGTIIGFAFLSIIPKKKMFFTSMGALSMNVYLWHFFLLTIMKSQGFYQHFYLEIQNNHFISLFIFILLAIIITNLLSSNLFNKYFGIYKIINFLSFNKIKGLK